MNPTTYNHLDNVGLLPLIANPRIDTSIPDMQIHTSTGKVFEVEGNTIRPMHVTAKTKRQRRAANEQAKASRKKNR